MNLHTPLTAFAVLFTTTVFSQNDFSIGESEQQASSYTALISEKNASFRKNDGQWKSAINYRAFLNGTAIRFLDGEVSYAISREVEDPAINPNEQETDLERREVLVWNTEFVGANFSSEIVSEGEFKSKVNYLKGNDPEKWVINASDYIQLTYDNIYKGVDLRYYKEDGQLKYDFIVEPNASLSPIQMKYKGVEELAVNRKGELEVTTPWGILTEKAPYSYQFVNGEALEVDVRYSLEGDDIVGFRIHGEYDPNTTLIIDPVVLQWGSFVGNRGDGYVRGVRIDNKGKVYGTGYYGGDWPVTPGVYGPANSGDKDIFAFKLSADGTTLEYSTYVGGSRLDDGFAAAVNDKEELHLTGWTLSSNYPTVSQFSGDKGGYDVFVSKLNAQGTGFVFSTYLGGTGIERGLGIDVGPNDDVYVTGYTSSANFPKKNAAPNPNSGGDDWFITRLKADGSALVYSTIIGGSSKDNAEAIAADENGFAYVTGSVNVDFPVSAGAYNGGATTGLGAVKINPTGGTVYSTIIGPGGGRAIDADANGNAYIGGWTRSMNGYPVTPGAYQQSIVGFGSHTYFWYQGEAVITKLSSDGSTLVYSTFLGGGDDERIGGLAVTKTGEVFVSGTTWSSNFPTTTCAEQSTYQGKAEAFVSKLSADGSALDYSTFMGGTADDYWSSMDLREYGECGQEVVATITSHSGDFPTTAGSYRPDHPYGPGLGSDCPVFWKLKPVIQPQFTNTTGTCNQPIQFTDQSSGNCIWKSGPWNPTSWHWDFGDGTTSTLQNPSHVFPGSGTFEVTLVVGCPADSVKKTIIIPGPFNNLDIGEDITKCQGPINELLDAGNQPGGTTYEWSTGASSPTITATQAGTYWVKLSKNGCSQTDTIEIKLQQITGSVDANDVTCFGGNDGSITAQPQGGNPPYNYSWDNGQSTQTASNLPAGTHTVTVTDQDGCSITAPITIDQPNDISITATATDASCLGSDGTASATASGGTGALTYSWTDGTQVINNAAINNLPPNTYTVTVTDANGCSVQESVVVNAGQSNIQGTITFQQDAGCATSDGMATVTPTGGTGPYTYLWDDPTGQTSRTANNLAAGTYNVTITDRNGCTGTTQVTINGSDGLNVQSSVTLDDGCDRNGGTLGNATATPQGGKAPYTYQWDDPTNQTVQTAVGLAIGTYTVTVTDASGCTSTSSVTIEQKIQISVNIDNEPCTGCTDGELTANVTGFGTPPFTYRWDDVSEQTTATATGLPPGTYAILVTDSKGCFNSDTVTIGITSIEDPFGEQVEVLLYPNPNAGQFSLELDVNLYKNVYANIYDISGKLILTEQVNSERHLINISDRPSGVYLVEVAANNFRTIQRVQVIQGVGRSKR